MSLKAKIEAVIYASEEPVTLAQLVGLLGEEAQAELQALESQQQSLALDEAAPVDSEAGDQDALNAETLGEGEAEAADDTDGATSELETADKTSSTDGIGEQQLPEGHGFKARPERQSKDAVKDIEMGGALAPEGRPADAGTADASPIAQAAAAQAKARERKLREYFRTVLDRLTAEYANGDHGLEIREVAGGFRMATKPEYHDAVRGFVKSLKPPLKLSLQALETLAVIAYKQPVTAPEIGEIRGVDSGGVLGSLMARKLITTAGRKQVIGRPILYKTTKEFLVRFGLKDINELPSIEEFEKMAGEFADASAQEEIPMEAPRNGFEEDAGVQSAPVDEINAAPAPTNLHHDTVEDIMSDKSTSPEGHNTEPADPHDVEPMRHVHQAQPDGFPDNGAHTDAQTNESVEAMDNHEPYTGDDERGA